MIFIRHGESVANAEERFTRGPEEELSPLGRDEARALSLHLAGSARVDHLYTSPFVRAQQTAAFLGVALQLEPRIVEDLREQHFGALRGRPYSALADATGRDGLARWDYRPPEGETLREVAARVGPAVNQLAEAHRGEAIVVVSHGGVMAALRAWISSDYASAPAPTGNAGGYWLEHSERGGFGALEPIDSLAPAEGCSD